MISAFEAHKRVTHRISSQALEQLNEIEQKIIAESKWIDPDDARCLCYYDTDLLQAEVRVLLNKLGYKVTGVGEGYKHKHRYCIDWRHAASQNLFLHI